MDTRQTEPNTMGEPDDREAVDAYLRAHGVTPATGQWEKRPGLPVKQRSKPLAFIVRILRKFGYDD